MVVIHVWNALSLVRLLVVPYQGPYRALQIGHVGQIPQHALEVVVGVVEASPKHDLADDVGHSVVYQGHRVKWLSWVQERSVFLLFIQFNLFCSCQPFSFSSASCRWRLSSQMLCSMELLARPKVLNVDMAKRRCLRHTFPLLKKRPAETDNDHRTLPR